MPILLMTLPLVLGLVLDRSPNVLGQGGHSRKVFELACNEPFGSQPQPAISHDCWFNDFEFMLTNRVFCLARAAAQVEHGIVSSRLFSPSPDLSRDLAGGIPSVPDERAGTEDCLNSPGFESDPAKSRYDQFLLSREGAGLFLLADLSRPAQPRRWKLGGGDWLSYVWPNQIFRLGLRGGRSFFESRDGPEGEHCVAVLFRWELGKRKPSL